LRRCIEVSRAWLPPEHAEVITRSAKEWACLMSLARISDDDEVLREVTKLMEIAMPSPTCRSEVSNVLIRASRIYYRRGRYLRAVAFLGWATMLRPVVIARPLERLLRRGVDGARPSPLSSR
jgi:hypothetical protein